LLNIRLMSNTSKTKLDKRLILVVKNLLDKFKIFSWIDEGTLLGIYRQKAIIPGDKDFDFSVNFKDMKKILLMCNELESLGFHVKYQKYLPYVEDLIQIYPQYDSEMNGFHVDLNIYYFCDSSAIRRDPHYPVGRINTIILKFANLFSYLSTKKGNFSYFNKILFNISRLAYSLYVRVGASIWQSIPEKFFSSWEECEFLNKKFKIPSNTEKYLTYRYGENWSQPCNNWSWKESEDKAIKITKLSTLNIKKFKTQQK